MARGQRFKKPTDSSVFGKVIEGAIKDASNLLNAVDFIDSPQGLNIQLYPLQRLIVKCIFAVPIDYKPVSVPMWDVFREHLVREVSEAECLHILHEEGRCNVNDWRDIPERGFNEAAIFAGRRGGKSQVVSAIGAYKLYRLLNIRSPQEYFDLIAGSHIDFTFMAQDDEGASRLYDKLREDINRAPFFNPYLKDSSSSSMGFVSEADRMKRDVTPSINVKSYPCLDQDELIWSELGLVSLRELAVGTLVYDRHHTLRRVTEKQFNEEEVWALETSSFRFDPLLLTPKHTCICVPQNVAVESLPYLKSGAISGGLKRKLTGQEFGIKPEAMPVEEVKEGDYFLFPRISEQDRQDAPLNNSLARTRPYVAKSHGKDYLREQSSARCVPELPVNRDLCRFYGLYVAEGSVSFGTIKWDFHINERDTLARFIQDTLQTVFGLPSRVELALDNGCRVVCCSIELARGLIAYFGNGSENKTIPPSTLTWTVESQLAFITGYLEGDGCDNRDIAPTVSKKLAYSLFNLGIQVRKRPSLMRREAYIDKKGIPHHESWYVEFCKQERHCRFYQAIEGVEYYWNKVIRNAPTGEYRTVVDISVEGTESFLTKLATVHNCTTNASRGPSNVFLALDEFAHFRAAKGSSSDEVYGAATPSTVNFKHAELPTGEWISRKTLEGLSYDRYTSYQDSLVLSISSPWTKLGKMYELHKQALDLGSSKDALRKGSLFTIRISTAEMNPTILPQTLRREYEKNPLIFKAEYGGQFLESSESYVTEAQIRACTDVKYTPGNAGSEEPDLGTARINLQRFHPNALGRQYFWAIDLGMSHDATAVAIAHLEYVGGAQPIQLVYDYIDRMMVGEKFEGPGVATLGLEKYLGFKALPLEDILSWLKALNEMMPCFRGATDQHGGQQLVQLLELNKIYNIELVNLTATLNSQMAYILQGYIRDVRCRFPYVPKFLRELRMVEAEYVNKHQIRVAAPLEKNSHDDMVDAAQLCAYKAQQWLMDEGGLRIDPSGQSLLISERMMQPSTPIANLDGVIMRDLQIMERMKKIQRNAESLGGDVVRNPFHRRG